MISIKTLLLTTLLILALSKGTRVKKCRASQAPLLSNEEVKVSPCSGPPCLLKKNTSPSIYIKFKAVKDVKEVITSAYAYKWGMSVPYVGVNGKSACSSIYSEDGNTKVGCPLKAGRTYTYKNTFKVENSYPKISATVWWSIVDKNTKDHLACFEIDAKIVS